MKALQTAIKVRFLEVVKTFNGDGPSSSKMAIPWRVSRNRRYARTQKVGWGGVPVFRTLFAICQMGVLCWYLMGRRGGPNVVFILFYFCFSARFAHQYYSYSACVENPYHFQVPSPFSNISMHTILGFYESAFLSLFCLILHDFTPFKHKKSERGPLDPFTLQLWHH